MVEASMVWGANKVPEPVDIKEEEQETSLSTVWGPSKVEDIPVKVDDQDMYLYDGDTLINKVTGERLRLRGYDAAEVSRIGKNNEFHLGTPAGETMTHEINKIIREMGFDRLVDSGEKGAYDRRLVDLANSQGMLLSDYLHQERVVKGSRWMTREQEMLRSFGSIADFINRTSNNISPGDRARGIVESVMGDSRLRPTFGTTQEVFKGSGYAVNHYQSVINNLNTVIKNTKDRSLKKQLPHDWFFYLIFQYL